MDDCKKISYYFSEFLQNEKENGLSKTTLKSRERHLNHFEKWLVLKDLSNMTPQNFSEAVINCSN